MGRILDLEILLPSILIWFQHSGYWIEGNGAFATVKETIDGYEMDAFHGTYLEATQWLVEQSRGDRAV